MENEAKWKEEQEKQQKAEGKVKEEQRHSE